MKYSVTCDETNNTYAHELQNEVVFDIRVEGVSQYIHVVLKPVGDTTWKQLRHDVFTKIEGLLRRYPDQQIIDEFYQLAVKYERSHAKKRR